MSVLPHSREYTAADYMKLPDYPRQELIGGEFFVSPAPKLNHQDLIGKIYAWLFYWLEKHPIGKVFLSPVDVILSEKNVVQPDLCFVLNNHLDIMTPDNLQGTPDFIIEILSPSNEGNDRIRKKTLYEYFGVTEYWIIDPKHATISVMLHDGKKYKTVRTFNKKSILKSFVIQGWELETENLFKR